MYVFFIWTNIRLWINALSSHQRSFSTVTERSRRMSFLTRVHPYPERRESGRDVMNRTEMSRFPIAGSSHRCLFRSVDRLLVFLIVGERAVTAAYSSLLILVPEPFTSMNRSYLRYRFAMKATDTKLQRSRSPRTRGKRRTLEIRDEND